MSPPCTMTPLISETKYSRVSHGKRPDRDRRGDSCGSEEVRLRGSSPRSGVHLRCRWVVGGGGGGGLVDADFRLSVWRKSERAGPQTCLVTANADRHFFAVWTSLGVSILVRVINNVIAMIAHGRRAVASNAAQTDTGVTLGLLSFDRGQQTERKEGGATTWLCFGVLKIERTEQYGRCTRKTGMVLVVRAF